MCAGWNTKLEPLVSIAKVLPGEQSGPDHS